MEYNLTRIELLVILVLHLLDHLADLGLLIDLHLCHTVLVPAFLVFVFKTVIDCIVIIVVSIIICIFVVGIVVGCLFIIFLFISLSLSLALPLNPSLLSFSINTHIDMVKIGIITMPAILFPPHINISILIVFPIVIAILTIIIAIASTIPSTIKLSIIARTIVIVCMGISVGICMGVCMGVLTVRPSPLACSCCIRVIAVLKLLLQAVLLSIDIVDVLLVFVIVLALFRALFVVVLVVRFLLVLFAFYE